MKTILELFSGTHSIGKIFKEDFRVISVDRDLGDDDGISDLHIKEDILTWDYKIYPKDSFDVIWASPVCLWWSKLRNTWIGRKLKGMDRNLTKKDIDDDIEKYGKPMVDKVREIIDYFKPTYYFIENPQTARMKDYITDLYFYDVDYCKYSDWGYRKRTRIWTNLKGFKPKICNKDCDNMIIKNGRKVHKSQISDNGGGSNRLARYRIPPLLIKDLHDIVSKKLDKKAEEQNVKNLDKFYNDEYLII